MRSVRHYVDRVLAAAVGAVVSYGALFPAGAVPVDPDDLAGETGPVLYPTASRH